MSDAVTEVYNAILNFYKNQYGPHTEFNPEQQRYLREWAQSWVSSEGSSRQKATEAIFGLTAEDYLRTWSRIIGKSTRSINEIEKFIEENQKHTLAELKEDIDRIELDIELETIVQQKPAPTPPTVMSEEEQIKKMVEMLLAESAKADKKDAAIAVKAEELNYVENLGKNMESSFATMTTSMKQTMSEIEKANQQTVSILENIQKTLGQATSEASKKKPDGSS